MRVSVQYFLIVVGHVDVFFRMLVYFLGLVGRVGVGLGR